MRGSVGRFFVVAGLVVTGFLAVVGGFALPPAGLLGAGLVAATVGCLAGGNVRDLRPGSRRSSAAEAAVVGTGVTFGLVLAFAGLVALVGGPDAVLVATVAVVVAFTVAYRRGATGARPARRVQQPAGAAGAAGPARLVPVLTPVTSLSSEALRREWLLSSSALSVLLDVGTREAIVRRRQQVLDELERRDPAGFARWLAAGPTPGSAPSGHLRGDAAADKDAA